MPSVDEKLDNLKSEVCQVKGQIANLTTLIAAYQKAHDTLEGRVWGLVGGLFIAMAGAIISIVVSLAKHN